MPLTMLACETIKDEVEFAISRCGGDFTVHWVESGLHNYPDILRAKLQEILDSLSGCERVLMAFGSCGNSVIGLKTHDFELIIPRVDDCISMLIGSTQRRLDVSASGGGMYFLTPGWLRGERNLWVEHQYAIEKYGEATAAIIMESMLSHYTRLGILDTKSYNVEDILAEVDMIAEGLDLERCIVPASLDYLQELLSGPWSDDRFVIVPPNSELRDFPLRLKGN